MRWLSGRTLRGRHRYNRGTMFGHSAGFPSLLDSHLPAPTVPLGSARLSSCLITALVVITALPATLHGQVLGHMPDASPYTDVDSPRELAIFAGYFLASKDLAGVAPRSSPVIGLRQTIHLGGPIISFLRLTHTFSDRTVVNPLDPASTRDQGQISDPITIADLNLGFNLLGDRSFHNIEFAANAGVGAASDLGAKHDIGRYRFGTVAVLTYGGGIRWVPPGRLSIRLNVDNYMYEHTYPKLYHTITGDGTSVIPTTHSLVAWRNNGMYTLGFSYAIHHH
jgi:hypothetical protein